MGNRAVITWSHGFNYLNELGVYLHCNGSPVSVSAFLKYCELRGFRSPDDDCYGYARFCQVVGNFLGGSFSIGIDICGRLDCHNDDNGVYFCKGWTIVENLWHNEETVEDYDFFKLLESIDSAQPEREQLGRDFFQSKEVPTSELKIGDIVFIWDHLSGRHKRCTVLGIGKDGGQCNGMDIGGIPYCDFFQFKTEPHETNINNYLLEKTCRAVIAKQ